MIALLVEHEGGNGSTGVGTVTSLATNMNGGPTPAVLVLGSGDTTGGPWHDRVSGRSVQVEITEVVDEGNDQPMVFLISLPG